MNTIELRIFIQTALLLLSIFAKAVTWLLAVAGVLSLSEWFGGIFKGVFLSFSISLLGCMGIVFVVESMVRTESTDKEST